MPLTPAQIIHYYYSGGGAPASTLLDGLIHVWHLDETGTSTSDLRMDSVGDVDLVPTAQLAAPVQGKNGLAYFNDGSSRFLTKDSSEIREAIKNYSVTFSVWFKFSATGVASIVGCWGTAGNQSIILNRAVNNNLNVHFFVGGTQHILLIANVTDSNWHHVVFGFDRAAQEVWAVMDNGPAVVETGVSDIDVQDGATLNIGAASTAGNHINGNVDEAYMWKRRPSFNEISELYNAGAGKFYPFSN